MKNMTNNGCNARPEYHYTSQLPVSQNRYSGGILALSHYTSTIPIIYNRGTGGIVGTVGEK